MFSDFILATIVIFLTTALDISFSAGLKIPNIVSQDMISQDKVISIAKETSWLPLPSSDKSVLHYVEECKVWQHMEQHLFGALSRSSTLED